METPPDWTREKLLGLARAFQEARLLLTGAELDLFTRLADKPRTARDLAPELQADLRALTILLDALSAMGLLEKREGAYQTESSARQLLTSDGANSVLPMLLHSAHLWERWGELTGKVAPPQADGRSEEDRLRSFIGAMHVAGAPLAARLVKLIQPGEARHLLDVGGGSGTYTLAFLEACPWMRATLFDRPAVVAMARERMEQEGMLDRVDLVAGDYNRDPLPTGHDLVFISAIIHQNTPAQNIELYLKAFEALDPGGRIVIRDHVLREDRIRPRSGALFAVNMLAADNGGNSYTFEEIRSGLSQAGFERIRIVHRDTGMDGLVEGFRPD
jgi:predicted O-methyltransferase YrrM